MTHTFSTFASGFALSAALIMAIGAQNLLVLRQGLKRQHVGIIVLFCGLSDALLITAGVAGLGAFLTAIPQLSTLLTIGGAAFLTWHGIAALRRVASAEAMMIAGGDTMSFGGAIAAAAGFTFLNPHVYLDTVLLMGAAGSAQPEDLRPVFVAGAILASFSWFAALGFGARYLAPLFARPGAWRVIDAVVGVTMLVLALSLLLTH
jgi:L-lysine exporter family protein LysE/ArgO